VSIREIRGYLLID